MALDIATFSNDRGGDALFKALGHPLAVERVPGLFAAMRACRRLTVFDPLGHWHCFRQFHGTGGLPFEARLIQRLDGPKAATADGLPVRIIGEPGALAVDGVLIAAFDAPTHLRALGPMLGPRVRTFSFDSLKLPPAMVSQPRDYLAPVNFATNLVLFRADDMRASVLHIIEYWTRYGAIQPGLWCRLFDGDGAVLADWNERLSPNQGLRLSAADLRRRFALAPFAGSLFVHAVGVAGHDVVKYVLDEQDEAGRDPVVTHDANGWPADWYAGFPAPEPGERVTVWIQNAHPCPIPAGALQFNRMGMPATAAFDREVPPFGTAAVDIGGLFPDLAWPDQIELAAGRHVVRPRYEISRADGGSTWAHANVERTDLAADPNMPDLLGGPLGKGWILPAPVLPVGDFATELLPTPMARGQLDLPLALAVFDPDGHEVLRQRLGRLARNHRGLTDVSKLVRAARPDFDHGHLELTYDLTDGGTADGWLHALFRYRHVDGQVADTSFGAHVFNIPETYRGEPQSYHGRPPGLTTRLALRLADAPQETWCCLIYPASKPWWPRSRTTLTLHDAAGVAVADADLAVPCSGSRLWRATDVFSSGELARAGGGGHIIIADRTCRLFGYHAMRSPAGGFALDHMFGF